MKLFANKSVSSDPNDMPLSTYESMDVNFVGRNNFGNNGYRGNFNPRPYPSNSSNNYGNSYNNSYGNFNNMPYDFETSVKEFMNSQKNFNALLEEKLLKVDDLARNCSDQTSNSLISVHQCHPWISNADTHRTLEDL